MKTKGPKVQLKAHPRRCAPVSLLAGVLCCCGAPARGRTSDGEPRCCATCAFHPLGCRCEYGDPPDTVNERFWCSLCKTYGRHASAECPTPLGMIAPANDEDQARRDSKSEPMKSKRNPALPASTCSAPYCSLCGEEPHKLSECPACLDNENTRKLLLTTRKALAALLKTCPHEMEGVTRGVAALNARRVLEILKEPRRETDDAKH